MSYKDSTTQASKLYVNLLTNAALCHLNLKQYLEAINVCNMALDVDADNLKGLYRRGLAFK